MVYLSDISTMSCVSYVVVVTQHALTDWAVYLTHGFVTHTMIVLTALMKWDALVPMGESCTVFLNIRVFCILEA